MAKKNITVEVTTCDKCGEEKICSRVKDLDLCIDCQFIWSQFIKQKTDDIVNKFIEDNRDTIFDEFKNATLKSLNIVKKF